jgi:hypothetical protein
MLGSGLLIGILGAHFRRWVHEQVITHAQENPDDRGGDKRDGEEVKVNAEPRPRCRKPVPRQRRQLPFGGRRITSRPIAPSVRKHACHITIGNRDLCRIGDLGRVPTSKPASSAAVQPSTD